MEIPKPHFRKKFKVYFADTDAASVAHHSRYLVWLEAARIDFLDALGCPYQDFQAQKQGFVPVQIDIKYLKPLVFADEFEVVVILTELNRASFTLESYFIKGGICHCQAKQRLASMDEANWKIIPMPERFIDRYTVWKQLES